MPLIVLKSLWQTSSSCPSQWSGMTTEDLNFYVRYRGSKWRVEVDDVVVCSGSAGGEYDGTCSFDDIKDWCLEKGVRIVESEIEALSTTLET